MSFDLWFIFIVNIAINSLLSFLTLSFFIFLSLKLLRIQNPRIQAICLLIPFMKLIVDLGNYQFSQWALAQQFNPLECPEGTRSLSIGFLFDYLKYPFCSITLHLQEGQTFTLADLLCLQWGPFWTMCCALSLIGITLGFVGKAIWHYRESHQWLKHMRLSSQLCSQVIQDPFLQAQIRRKQISIYLSTIPHAPCIIGQRHPSIFLSRTLFDQLTPQEFEAIIAHEVAHLQQGDLIINSYLFWICHCFWWIPTSYLKRKLELAQEYACDRLLHTNILHIHLAEALYKTAQWLRSTHLPILAQPAATSHHAVKRLQKLLSPPKHREIKILKWIKCSFLFIWITILICGKFWTF